MPTSGTEFQNAGLLPASAKLAVKYRPSRWNTGHLAALAAMGKPLRWRCWRLIRESFA